jgi:hypothetical protein
MPERKASPRAKTGEGKPTPAKRAAKKTTAKKAVEPEKVERIQPTKPLEPLAGPDPEQPDTWQPAPPDDAGFVGNETDPTPNENYSVAGVTSGQPTPETDDDASAAVQKL